MQLTFGFLSLLFIMPFAMADPIAMKGYANDLQSQAVESQPPISVTDMDAAIPRGRIQWVRCSGRSRRCVAKVAGRRWRAVWRLRSFRRGLLEGDEDNSELFHGRSGRLILNSIKCDAAKRPQVCTGRVKTGHVATWVVRIPAPYFDGSHADPAEESLIDELEEMTAEGDFAEDELLNMDELLEEEQDDADDIYSGNELSEGDDNGELFEEAVDDDGGHDGLFDDEVPLAPIQVRSLTCGRHSHVCKAALLSQGLVAKWNVRIRYPWHWRN